MATSVRYDKCAVMKLPFPFPVTSDYWDYQLKDLPDLAIQWSGGTLTLPFSSFARI